MARGDRHAAEVLEPIRNLCAAVFEDRSVPAEFDAAPRATEISKRGGPLVPPFFWLHDALHAGRKSRPGQISICPITGVGDNSMAPFIAFTEPLDVQPILSISASEIRCQSALRVIDSLRKSVENKLP